MKKFLPLLASGLLLLAGCAAPQVATTGSGAMLILTPEVVSGDYRGLARPGIEPYTADNVNRLVVKLYTVADGVEAPVVEYDQPVTRAVDRESIDEPLVFSRLKAKTTYRVKTEAWGYEYMYTTLDIDPEKLISTDDVHSTTDIVVTNDDRPTVGKLKVRLKARSFSGETYFGVEIKNGGTTAGASESLTLVDLPN